MDKILIINKEKNCTSRDVVNLIEKQFNTKKVGHTGTLDPMATGVLIICTGKSLKVADMITADKKEYIAKSIIGMDSDTLDITGTISKNEYYEVSFRELNKTLKSFLGESIQEVPKYSSVKVNGKRLYEYARANTSVELPKRVINIYNIELLNLQLVDNHLDFSFKVLVSKGTYIRSLIRDIGIKLGTTCCMKELVRTKQGKFCIEDSYTLEDIKNGNYKLIDIKDAIDIEKVYVNDDMLFKIKNGQILPKFFKSDKALILDKKGKEIGIYITYDKDINMSKPLKIF